MNEYLFLHLDTEKLSEKIIKDIIQQLSTTRTVHIYNKNSVLPSELHNILQQLIADNHLEVFFYCFSIEQFTMCQDYHYTPHIAFKGQDIVSHHFLDYIHRLKKSLDLSSYEVFWFPNKTDILQDNPEQFVSSIKSLGCAVCISLSDIFNPHSLSFQDNETARVWLKKMYQQLDNPLIHKELELLENEAFSEKNLYLYVSEDQYLLSHIVLGLLGDVIVDDIGQYRHINSRILMKNKRCNTCEYFEYCERRGLGYIMDRYRYQDCIGIKLIK